MTPNLPTTPVADEIGKLARDGVSAPELLEMLPTPALRVVQTCLANEAALTNARVVSAGDYAHVVGAPGDILTKHNERRHDALRAFLHVLQVELDGREDREDLS